MSRPRPSLRCYYGYVREDGAPCDKKDAHLGSGAFGATYRMRNRLDNQIRAVKQTTATTLSEARVLAELPRHEHVVAYFGCRRALNGGVWVVMELVGSGETVQPCRHYPWRSQIVSQVAAALGHIHAHGMLHRDVKSSNVFLSAPLPGGRAVLGDFGHADRTVGGMYQPSGEAPCGRGHWVYRAPEVLLGLPYGPPADMWALGVLALELVVGMGADRMVGNSDAAGWHRDIGTWTRTTEEGRETLEEIAEDTRIAGGLAIVTTKLLADDPDRRPAAGRLAVPPVIVVSPITRPVRQPAIFPPLDLGERPVTA
jgi:serine/threonine protein kinase